MIHKVAASDSEAPISDILDPASIGSGLVQLAPSRAGPTAEDWERYRPLIKRLYVDERMKLKEVVAVMSSQHGHHAT
jgi:Clr5 domain